MTAREIYALFDLPTTRNLYWPLGAHHHLPEVSVSEIPDGANRRVAVRTVFEHDFDDRRYMILFTVWLDDRPVMICQNAGREGRDHAARWVTDAAAYAEMVGYLTSLVRPESWAEQDLDLDAECPELTRFYGAEIEPSDLGLVS